MWATYQIYRIMYPRDTGVRPQYVGYLQSLTNSLRLFVFADKTMNNRTGRSSTLKNVKYYADGRSGQTGNFECPSMYFGCILNCSLNLPDHKNSKDPYKKSTFLAPIQTYKIRTDKGRGLVIFFLPSFLLFCYRLHVYVSPPPIKFICWSLIPSVTFSGDGAFWEIVLPMGLVPF